MSDCLPCQSKIDPAFKEWLEQKKRQAAELKNSATNLDQGISMQRVNEGQISIDNNLYRVVSTSEDGKITVTYEGDFPITPRLPNV